MGGPASIFPPTGTGTTSPTRSPPRRSPPPGCTQQCSRADESGRRTLRLPSCAERVDRAGEKHLRPDAADVARPRVAAVDFLVAVKRALVGPRRLLYLVTEDWFFLSYRRELARLARGAGYEVVVATRVDASGALITAEGFRLEPLAWKRGSLN